jgi:hypothetical protein
MRSFLSVTLLLAAVSPVLAHRLIVDPKIDGDRIRVEAYYEDDTPAQNALVTVFRGEQKVAEGRTDDKGVWTCPKPAPATYTVQVKDSGHAGSKVLVIPDPSAGPSVVGGEPETREEKTRTPWGRIAVGLALIVGLTLLWRYRPKSAPPTASPE